MFCAYSQQFVSDLQPPVFMCRSSFDDLGNIDAVVARDVLVPHSACYTEAKTCNTSGPESGPGSGHSMSSSTNMFFTGINCKTYSLSSSLKKDTTETRCCQFNTNRAHKCTKAYFGMFPWKLRLCS